MTIFPKLFARFPSVLRLAGFLLLGFAVLVPLEMALDLNAATPDSVAASREAGSTLSIAEHLERLGVAAWHKAGDRGRGLKVLVLDSGFSGYRAHLGHALPEKVTVKSFRLDGSLEATSSQHGILCGEVVHTLAPEAELLFANWEPDRADQFLDAVRWAKEQGARIVTCSLIMPSWSDGEGGGSVHRDLARILGNGDKAGDLLFFASAGNTAQRHWTGPFAPSGKGGDHGYHEWTPGCQDNVISPWGADVVSVELCCATGGKYEVSVYDVTAQEAVGSAESGTTNDHVCAVVRFLPKEDHAYTARVRQRDGKVSNFHLVVLGGGLQVANAKGSVPFPADGPEVIAVGAVDRNGQRMAYSSCGPNSDRPKPDFVAPVPFPSSWRSVPFSGTSAAAPQAAALAGLIWCKHPDWSAQHIREELRTDAERLAKTSHNFEIGYGRIHLP